MKLENKAKKAQRPAEHSESGEKKTKGPGKKKTTTEASTQSEN